MVRRLHEGMELPDLVGRQALAEGRHLGAFSAVDHRLEELLVGELGGEEVRTARAGAVMTYVALASVDIAAGGDRFGLPTKRIGQAFRGPAGWRKRTGQACQDAERRTDATAPGRSHRWRARHAGRLVEH